MRRTMMVLALALGLVACRENAMSLAEQPTLAPTPPIAATALPTTPTPTLENSAALLNEPFRKLLVSANAHAELFLVQQRLVELGYAEEGIVNGMFTDKTYEAIRLFQQFHGLKSDAGLRDETWKALFSPAALPFSLDLKQVQPFGSLGYLAPDGRTIRRLNLRTDSFDDLVTLQINPGDTIWKIVADPTGSYFAVQSGEFNELAMYAADGTLHATYSGMTDFQWSPDGRYFSVRLGAIDRPVVEIWRTEHVDNEGPLVTMPAWRSGWLLDGSGVVVAQDNALITHDLATGVQRTLTAIDNPEQIDTLLTSDGGVFFYTNLGADPGNYGAGKQWAVVSIDPEGPDCAQNGFGCGEIIPITKPNGSWVDESFFARHDNRLVFAETVRSDACASEQPISVMVPKSNARPKRAPVPSDFGDGYETMGAALPPGSAWLLYSIRGYTCDDGALEYGPAAIYSWNLTVPYYSVEVIKLFDGSFPFWLQ